MQIQLNHPYPTVIRGARTTLGGNQGWSARWDLRKCGCGAVAMTDLLVYLHRYHGCPGPALPEPCPWITYDKLLGSLQLRYLPMVPPFGITGLGLAAGLECYCRREKLPFTVRWGVRTKNFWEAMAAMLEQDLPVIFAIGPNFPPLWKQYKLNLYRKNGAVYTATAQVRGHFLTALGLDDHWIRVTSWGKEYYISRREYEDYGRAHALSLANNLLVLKRKA